MLWHGKNFRGIINKAKQMIFDNTGTDLISTNAEDAIKEVNSNLSPTSVSVTYGTGVTAESGGVYRMGKLVIVQVRLNTTSSMTDGIVSGLPTPKNTSTSGGIISVDNNKNIPISINGFGVVNASTAVSAGTLLLSTAYFTE